MKPSMVVGFCNPLLDITVVGNQEILDKYGLKSNDAVMAEEKHLGIYDEIEKDPNVLYTAGGSGQNSLRVVQWVLGKPKSAAFFGAVGNDRYGEILKREASKDGLEVKYQYHPDKATGTCAVIVTNDGKHRSLCANLSAAWCYTNDHLDEQENKDILENAKFYLVTGFFMASNLSTVQKIANIACEKNRPLLFSMSAAFIYEHYFDSVMSILPYINVMVGSTDEAIAFAKAINWNTDNVEIIAMKMSQFNIGKQGYRLVILTDAEKPVVVALRGLVSKYNVPKVADEDIVDTNGAGDAFIGAFIAKYVGGFPLKTCIHSGINAAVPKLNTIAGSAASRNYKTKIDTESTKVKSNLTITRTYRSYKTIYIYKSYKYLIKIMFIH